MMKKNIFLFTLVVITTNTDASGKKLVDCRFVTGKTTECNTYPSKFIYTTNMLLHQKVDQKREKLIISKTLPRMDKPKILHVISVEDMIENHLEVNEPIRFSKDIHDFAKEQEKIEQRDMPSKIADHKDTNATTNASVIASADLNGATLIDTNQTSTTDLNKTALGVLKPEYKPSIDKLKREQERLAREKRKKLAEKRAKKYPKYTIQKGDSLNSIAKRFHLTTKQITAVNYRLKKTTTLKIGKNISLPISNYKFNILQKSDNKKRSKLAKKLKNRYLHMKKKGRIKTLNEYNKKLISPLRGKHSLRVQATAYSSHRGQTDKTPFLAAWNNRIRPGMKIIAVSRDLIYKYGLGNGKRVRIQGLPGYYRVRDKMNKRYTKRIDIYMGVNRRKALRWGRRRTVIYW